MKTKVYLAIAIRIIVLFSLAIGMTYVSELLQASGFFGDSIWKAKNQFDYADAIDAAHRWGARHYWYFWGCFLLFILSVINVIMSIVLLIEKEYDI